MTVDVVFETHSYTVDNERGTATGWLDGTLSERGRALAAELGARRRGDVDAVFSSDLPRAIETVEIAFGDSELPIRFDSRLRECNYGAWNGMPVRRFEVERAGRVHTPFPAGRATRQRPFE